MSLIKNHYHDVINAEISDDEYFQLMSEKEWQEAVEEERQRLQHQFGGGAMSQLMFGKFLNKNGES